MTKKSKKMQLIECYGKCMAFENELGVEMQKLGRLATEIYGEELSADICDGSEIEFRKLDEDGYVDSNSTIRIEEIIAKTK